MHRERILEMFDLDTDADHGSQSPVRCLKRACNRCHPIAGGAAVHRVADGDALSVRHNPPEIIAIADISATFFGRLEDVPMFVPSGDDSRRLPM